MFRSFVLTVAATASVLWAGPEPQRFQRPVVFEPNRGQAPEMVKWIARGSGYQLFVTGDGATMMVADAPAAPNAPAVELFPGPGRPRAAARQGYTAVKMKLTGSRAWDSLAGLAPTGGVSNYLIGNDPTKWRTDVPHFASLKAASVYDGIDLVLYTHGSDLEYDFLIAPEADPKQIRLAFDGVDRMQVTRSGDLLLTTASGSEMRHIRPRVYQNIDGHKVEIASAYEILQGRQATFALASYDRRRTLVIDPGVVTYTRFLGGGSADSASGIAVDSSGNAYVTGTTISPDFPVAGSYEGSNSGLSDAFLTKLAPNGSIVFSTYFGGRGDDSGNGIAVDSTGVYITGATTSSDFHGSRNLPANSYSDMFVTKFSLTGSNWIYSHAFGGSYDDGGNGIAVDASHAAYVTGYTLSHDFPVFGQQWRTVMAGDSDVFLMKVDPNGAISTTVLIGGSSLDIPYGIAVDGGGSPAITGVTCSHDFPYTPPTASVAGCNTFVARVNSLFTGFVFSSVFGGGSGFGRALALDISGNVYVTGFTHSAFPTTPGAYQFSKPGPDTDGFVMKLDSNGARVYATYLGGSNGWSSGLSIAVDTNGAVYVAGQTASTTFPGAPAITPNPTAGFYSKLSPQLSTLEYTIFLGAAINGIAIHHPVRIFSPPETLIYTTGYRYTGGTSYTDEDAFVVQLNEPVQIVTAP